MVLARIGSARANSVPLCFFVLWRGDRYYQTGKRQLTTYFRLAGMTEGFYVVFDYRRVPVSYVETGTMEGGRFAAM